MAGGSIYPINKKNESTKTGQPHLSASTRAKLEDLGVNTENIITERQGQVALKEAVAKHEQAKNQTNPSARNPQDVIKMRAKALAAELRIPVPTDSDTDKILGSISAKLNHLKLNSNNVSQDDLANYRLKFNSINHQFNSLKQQKAQAEAELNESMNALARYNKFGLKLD